MAGGIPKYVPLRPIHGGKSSGDWVLDVQELERNITSKTKMLVLNTPQNIPGKVWSRKELESIADVVKRHPNILVLSDEVYEGMTYDDKKHTKIASLPGMFERTITLGSAGKSFSVTGWKTGWAIGPKDLVEAIWSVHQNVSFCSTTPLQEAIAIGFEKIISKESDYLEVLRKDLQRKRNQLCSVLQSVGLEPVVPEGSYFVLANISGINPSIYMDSKDSATKDFQFCRWLPQNIGVTAIPPTAFYTKKNSQLAENFVRFCFIKKDETLQEAEKRLQKLKSIK